jgi:uncharacterized protein (TIGR03067 family)
MSTFEQTTFVQRAARFSWQLSILTVFLAVLSRTVPGALVVGECFAFAAIISGVAFGGLALLGVSRTGSRYALRPALIGTLANGILFFIFVTNFVKGYQDSRRAAEYRRHVAEAKVLARTFFPTNHLGTWEAQTTNGERITWTFTPARFTWTTRKGQSQQFQYEMDYQKNPVWFTVPSQQSGMAPMLMIVEFIGRDKMRALGTASGSIIRPTEFGEGKTDILEFERRR